MYCFPYLQFSNSSTSSATKNKHNSRYLSHILPLVWVYMKSLSLTQRPSDSSPISSCVSSGLAPGPSPHNVSETCGCGSTVQVCSIRLQQNKHDENIIMFWVRVKMEKLIWCHIPEPEEDVMFLYDGGVWAGHAQSMLLESKDC